MGHTRGTGPPFLDWGYRIPTSQDTDEQFAVIRGDLRRLRYTKTVFGRGSVLDPARGLTSRLCTQERHVFPSSIGTPTFRPKLRPCLPVSLTFKLSKTVSISYKKLNGSV